MTYRQPTHSTPEPKKPRPARAKTSFDRPDAEQAAEGKRAERQTSAQGNDAQHGYSQDSGYATSGGYRGEATGDKRRTRTNVSEESETSFDQDRDELPETD